MKSFLSGILIFSCIILINNTHALGEGCFSLRWLAGDYYFTNSRQIELSTLNYSTTLEQYYENKKDNDTLKAGLEHSLGLDLIAPLKSRLLLNYRLQWLRSQIYFGIIPSFGILQKVNSFTHNAYLFGTGIESGFIKNNNKFGVGISTTIRYNTYGIPYSELSRYDGVELYYDSYEAKCDLDFSLMLLCAHRFGRTSIGTGLIFIYGYHGISYDKVIMPNLILSLSVKIGKL